MPKYHAINCGCRPANGTQAECERIMGRPCMDPSWHVNEVDPRCTGRTAVMRDVRKALHDALNLIDGLVP